MRGIIGRVGGKSKLRERIIGMMPKHTIYIEPFVGGGSVLFGRKEDPNIKEIVNDKDREVASVYSGLPWAKPSLRGYWRRRVLAHPWSDFAEMLN